MARARTIARNSALAGLPVAAVLAYLGSRNPGFVERAYSRAVYPIIAQAISRTTGVLPVSLGEMVIILGTLAVIASVYRLVIQARAPRRLVWPSVRRLAVGLLAVVSAVYFLFTITWGLNYYRLPYADIVGLRVQPASVEQLAELCRALIADANELRQQVAEDRTGVMRLSGDRDAMFARADLGYKQAATVVPQLGGDFGRPKGIILSRALSYAGIAGIYFPYTGEANVNAEIPDFSLPSTASHEMAHQRGFAREDEANYIAYVVCMSHPDPDFRYSGTMLAVIHSMNALWGQDPDQYAVLYDTYSPAVKRDLKEHNRFWTQFEGPVERVSDKINDTYLKTQGQADGTQSYGRMVDLLLAQHQKEKEQPGK